MNRKYCYFHLTCQPGNETEIADALLERKLIACAKFIPVHSTYRWKDALEQDDETLIILESAHDLYDEVKAVVAATIKGYDTFVLTEVPMSHVNDEAVMWLSECLKEAS